MFTASEATGLTRQSIAGRKEQFKEKLSNLIPQLEEQIQAAASRGERSVMTNVRDNMWNSRELSELIVEECQQSGYTVSFDGQSITVEWGA